MECLKRKFVLARDTRWLGLFETEEKEANSRPLHRHGCPVMSMKSDGPAFSQDVLDGLTKAISAISRNGGSLRTSGVWIDAALNTYDPQILD